MFKTDVPQKSNIATVLECGWGQPPIHRALSTKRSNHSFVQSFFLPFATFSYHPLVPHQPDLLPLFIHWPMYHKLKLSCPLPHVEIVGNPTIWALLNCFDRFLFFSITPMSTGNWRCVCVCVWMNNCASLDFPVSWHEKHFTACEVLFCETPGCLVRCYCNTATYVSIKERNQSPYSSIM